ncbi:MAG: hypothetical protein ICV64_11825 [Thermoleophilia bacterium]|nr:hypothetical protein [Thermoleophilia bacterium]
MPNASGSPDRRALRRAHLEAELHASRRASTRRRLAVGLAVALAAVLVPTAGVAAYLLSRADPPGGGTWTWASGVPGRPAGAETANRIAHFSAMGRNPVDERTVREVVRLRTDRGVHRLLAARARDGRVCFASVAERVWGAFTSCFPLREPFPRGHPLFLPTLTTLERQSDPVIAHFRSEGGPEPRTVGWATILGVARSDVTRLVGTLADGSEVELPLNQWRAFAYSSAPPRFPTQLVAYGERRRLLGSDEYVIQHVPLGRTALPRPAPLCGGVAGPCDPELERLSRRARSRE